MNVEKKVIGQLEKCYSLAVLPYQGKDYLMVAAEKVNQCRLYDWDGTLKDVIWDEPGGAIRSRHMESAYPDGNAVCPSVWHSERGRWLLHSCLHIEIRTSV